MYEQSPIIERVAGRVRHVHWNPPLRAQGIEVGVRVEMEPHEHPAFGRAQVDARALGHLRHEPAPALAPDEHGQRARQLRE